VLATNFGSVDPGGPIEYAVTLSLVEGRREDIKIEYLEQSGDATMRMYWSSLSTPRDVVPSYRLYPPTGGVSRPAASPAGGLPGAGSSLFSGATIDDDASSDLLVG
jgi:hypothetical protein